MNAVDVEPGGQVRSFTQRFTLGLQGSHLFSFVRYQQFDASKYGFFGDLQDGEDAGLEGSLEVRFCCPAILGVSSDIAWFRPSWIQPSSEMEQN